MASELQSLFAKEMESITGQIFAAGPDAQAPTYYMPSRRERAPVPDVPPKLPRVSESRGAKSSAEKARLAQREEMEMMKSRIQQLEGELHRMTMEVNERQGKGEKALDARPMTMEEKKALSMEINQLKGSDLEEVVRIVWGQMAGEQMQQNDIELDLSAMPNETLRKLERYIVQCKEAKKAPKRQRKPHLHAPREKTFDFDDNQFVDDFEDSCRGWGRVPCSGLGAGGILGIVSYRILLVLYALFVEQISTSVGLSSWLPGKVGLWSKNEHAKSLFLPLRPIYFGCVLFGAKLLDRYDFLKETFPTETNRSPAYTIELAFLLRKRCGCKVFLVDCMRLKLDRGEAATCFLSNPSA